MNFERAARLKKLPPYLFREIDEKKKAAREAGVDLIDLGVGDPDLPTPPLLIRALARASQNPAYHQYPFGAGLLDLLGGLRCWLGVVLYDFVQVHLLYLNGLRDRTADGGAPESALVAGERLAIEFVLSLLFGGGFARLEAGVANLDPLKIRANNLRR